MIGIQKGVSVKNHKIIPPNSGCNVVLCARAERTLKVPPAADRRAIRCPSNTMDAFFIPKSGKKETIHMLLIGNGRLITRSQTNPYLEDGAVVLDGEAVQETGTLTALRAKYPQARFVDARGGVIMPGLINVHTHI